MINATGLWINKTKNGDEYLSGSLGGVKVLIFKNNNKKQENHPDYQMIFAPNEKRPTEKKESDSKGTW